MLWYDIIWYVVILYDMIWYYIIWYNIIQYVVIWYDVMCCDIILEGLELIESISYRKDDNLFHYQPNAISLHLAVLYSTVQYYNTIL